MRASPCLLRSFVTKLFYKVKNFRSSSRANELFVAEGAEDFTAKDNGKVWVGTVVKWHKPKHGAGCDFEVFYPAQHGYATTSEEKIDFDELQSVMVQQGADE